MQLAVWYDFSDLSTLFTDTALTTPATAEGAVVAGVKDKSGSGFHATQNTAGNRPTLVYGRGKGPSLAFGLGTTHLISSHGGFSTPFTVIVSVQFNAISGIYMCPFMGGAGTMNFARGPSNEFHLFSGISADSPANVVPSSRWMIMGAMFISQSPAPGNDRGWLNGVNVWTANSGDNSGGVYVGGVSESVIGEMGEFRYFKGTPTDTEMSHEMGQMYAKWVSPGGAGFGGS